MNVLRIAIKYFLICLLFLYLAFLFVLPTVVNSNFFLSKINDKLSDINDAQVSISSINLKTRFDVSSELFFKLDVKLPELQSSLIVGENGCVSFKLGQIYVENLSVKLSESQLLLSGLIYSLDKKSNVSIKGDDLPVSDIQASLLHFQKYRNKGQKVFIENFKDFTGLMDVDLTYRDNGLYGTCKTQNLGAHSVLFDVPISFNNAVFNFDDRLVWAEAEGTLGEEDVFTSFILTNMATPEQEVKGKVLALLTDELAEKYIPNTSIKEDIIASVDYSVKNKKINVDYSLNLPIGSDLGYKNAHLGLDNFSRRLLVQTEKVGNKLEIKSYDYSLVDDNDITNILLGSGLLLNANGWYDFSNHSSDIIFSAKDIDSNVVADTVFGLSNQISGLASANLHAKTKNKLENISGNASFSIKHGYLPKLGSTEFIISKSKKFKKPLKIKLSDIINVDITKAEALASDINGSFSLFDFDMQDICLTSQQKYLSLYIEGDYNIEQQEANLQLFGKYNKIAPKGIKVLFIPLDWILKFAFRPEESKDVYQQKLDKIPSINAKKDEEQNFRVKVDGNINENNINVELKAIK